MHTLSQKLPPTVLTIFGITGDLALRYLLPSLFHLIVTDLLGHDFLLVGVGRRDLTVEEFWKLYIEANPNAPISSADKKKIFETFRYQKVNFDEPESFKSLAGFLDEGEKSSGKKHSCFNRLYYFATSPEYFAPIAGSLKQQGLLIGCKQHNRTIRVLIEKPFGYDLSSAQQLNAVLKKHFTEQQIYRIDHYLGKETVQNLEVLRFGNDLWSSVWNNKFIDHVEISALESVGVGRRGPFYDQVGALRDLVQNHLLQILALVAMEEPASVQAGDIAVSKLAVLKNLQPFNSSLIGNAVFAQYREYNEVPGYVQEIGKKTKTETFVAFKTFVNTPRFRGVPFYVRTGKRLANKATEVSIHFKQLSKKMFKKHQLHPSVLTLTIQPNESISLSVNNKTPGFDETIMPQRLSFGYAQNYKEEIPPAYERLLLDFLLGDQRLFITTKEIEASWKFVDSLLGTWSKAGKPMASYPAGSEGPKQAEALIKKDGKRWWAK